ncbi:MAG TPA: hypothetical protein VGC74_11340 [Stenotrophomonas sp.]|jgi:hypothetical protein
MANTPNSGNDWTEEDLRVLGELIQENTPTRVIGLKLGRTEDAIRDKVAALGWSLKPTNQAPQG